ncbi:MAG TPA: hypothetical protein VHL09_08100 [Dehalococcoidia bacterium]|nr:hypothetical protein [Dehalococcoidia bacterium]
MVIGDGTTGTIVAYDPTRYPEQGHPWLVKLDEEVCHVWDGRTWWVSHAYFAGIELSPLTG